jgi:hypothetical protein
LSFHSQFIPMMQEAEGACMTGQDWNGAAGHTVGSDEKAMGAARLRLDTCRACSSEAQPFWNLHAGRCALMAAGVHGMK